MDKFTTAEYWQTHLDKYVVPFAQNLVIAAIIFIVGRFLIGKVMIGIDKLLVRNDVDEMLRRFLGKLLKTFLTAILVIFCLERLGVETTAAVAILGAAGLAIGFALKDSLGNFASGVMVMIFRPYKLGDLVKAGGVTGIVEEVQTFNTIIHTPDGKKVIVPNSKITTDVIENWTSNGTIRVDLEFGVGYDTNLEQAKKVLSEVLAKNKKVLQTPASTVAVVTLADFSVNLVCRPWCDPAHYWDVYFEVTEAAKIALDAAGIDIPYPTEVQLNG